MNIFNKYGIKEVADVTFYSITRVGDEEFYTPVLFFDTLKVSTLDKNVETVSANGGKGNGKILSWNFNGDTKLTLEDALFSEASMDMFMNGRIQSKLADWTSAITKLNVANKYGQLHYSTKAYPSPKLTLSEWEIVFRCAQKAGYSAKYGDDARVLNDQNSYKYVFETLGKDSNNDRYVAENRKFLTEKYMKRNQYSPQSRNLAYYYDFKNGYTGVDIQIEDNDIIYNGSDSNQLSELAAAQLIKQKITDARLDQTSEVLKLYRNLKIRYVDEKGQIYSGNGQLIAWINIDKNGFYCQATKITAAPIITKIFDNVYCGYDVFNNHIFYYFFPKYLSEIIDLCYCDMHDKIYKAMPISVINEIIKEIDSIKKVGFIDTDLYDSKYIDRFEKCIVTKRDGFVIDAAKQRENLSRYYNNDFSDSYTIYYDAKTMLPLFNDKDFTIKNNSKQYADNIELNISNQKDLLNLMSLINIKSGCPDDFKYQIMNFLSMSGLNLINYFKNSIDDIKQLLVDNSNGALTLDDIDHIEEIIYIDELDNNGLPIGIEVITSNYKITNIKFQSGSILIKYVKKNPNLFRIKKGTVYYKWTRTIDEPGSIYTTIGTDLMIDADTFSDEYRIVGETYIREQKTGKDQRYQFVLKRAKVSSTTSIELQADGDPVTFSIDIDVLMPRDKVMVELRQFDVEEDKREGGFRIVPRNKRYSYTPTNQDYEESVIDNNEIY